MKKALCILFALIPPTATAVIAEQTPVPVYEEVSSLSGCQAMRKLSPLIPKDCRPKKYGPEVVSGLGLARGAPFRSRLDQVPSEEWVPNTPVPGVAVRVLHFGRNADQLSPEGEALVFEVETILMKVPAAAFRIEGHTDSSGNDAYNLALSERRVAAVTNRLSNFAGRLRGKGHGETRLLPGRPGTDPANRRVEIIPVTTSQAATL